MADWLPDSPPSWWGAAATFFGALTGGALGLLIEFANNPVDFIMTRVVGWLVDEIVNPLLEAAVGLSAAIGDSLFFIFLGADKQLSTSITNPGALGVADLPMYVAYIVYTVAEPQAQAVLDAIGRLNLTLASLAADAGLAALPVVTILTVAEVAALGLALLYAAQIGADAAQLGGVVTSARSFGDRVLGVIR